MASSGSLSTDLSASKMAVAPLIADVSDRPGRPYHPGSGNVGLWDKASTVGKAPVTLFDDSEVRISPIATC
jgi:hypothetical protein